MGERERKKRLSLRELQEEEGFRLFKKKQMRQRAPSPENPRRRLRINTV